ncbi:MAG: DUF2809 domain-containing protein [Lachnospiraceae bacterium]|nr:DUF2809 domain-containing protein [Lachnospiraceae bacterium]
MRKRILYAVATLFLLLIEVIIALYVHDDFIRSYVGDILVVIVIYTFIRMIVPEKYRLIPLFIFIFAVGVELLQLVNIVGILGVADNIFLKTLMGSVFDIKDIVCYAVGCVILCMYEWIRARTHSAKKET